MQCQGLIHYQIVQKIENFSEEIYVMQDVCLIFKKTIPVNGTLWFCFSTKRFFLRVQYFRDKTRKPVKSNHAHCLNPSQHAKHALDLRSRVSTIMNTVKVASCRLVYFSILDSLSKDIHRQSSYFPFINILKILGYTTNQDSLLLATLL